MNLKKIKQDIKRHEGYRDHIYVDTVGVLTGGYGHAFHKGSKLPDHIWDEILSYDISEKLRDTESFLSEHQIEWLDDRRQEVIFNMIFNMGYKGLNKFKKFIAAMQGSDWRKASAEMLDSRWAKQVGYRAIELAGIMERGK